MEKINVAELLKDCPKGMELECTIYDNLYFDCIREHQIYPIVCYTVDSKGEKHKISFNWYGKHTPIDTAKCVIFPKGKTTWEGFVPPCKFKDGDIIVDEHGNIAIYKGTMWYNKKLAGYYCGYRKSDNHFLPESKRDGHFGVIEELHHATEEEKEKFFQVILDNRYRWNTETKKLEKLFPYNIGTKVWVRSDKEHKYIHIIVGISYNSFGNLEYEVKEEKTGIVVHYPKELLIPITKELNFKVGDIIRSKNCPAAGSFIIVGTKEDSYLINIKGHCIKFDDQDNYELVPKKFDITTLKPFDKVLVRTKNFTPVWTIAFYDGYQPNIGGSFRPFGVTNGEYFQQCIPYEGNEHLRGTTDDCDDFYKTWE